MNVENAPPVGEAPAQDAPASTTPAPAEREAMIPRSRFDQVVQERDAARADAQRFQASGQRVTELEAQLATEQLRGQAYRTGLHDSDTIDFAMSRYSAIEGDRPAFGDWLSSDAAPTPVRLMMQQSAKASQPPAQPETPAQPAPAPQQTSAPAPAAEPPVVNTPRPTGGASNPVPAVITAEWVESLPRKQYAELRHIIAARLNNS
jgi:hypothetical protein